MSSIRTAPGSATVPPHKIVSREEWLEAREKLLAKEKKYMREGDALAAERRALPWARVEKSYLFDAPGDNKKTLGELFAGRSQLLIYHLMFAPEWEAACLGCSFVSDHFDGAVQHLANRDATLVAVSRAPLARFTPFQQRMGWRFQWYSSFGTDFNRDFHVSFSQEEMAAGKMFYNYKLQSYPMQEGHGLSAFYQDATGDIFHTYSTYGRGVEAFINTYHLLDLAPKGRDEQDQTPHPMAWVRHHDKYQSDYFADRPARPAEHPAGQPGSPAHDCCRDS